MPDCGERLVSQRGRVISPQLAEGFVMLPLLLAQFCCVALAAISGYGAWKTFRQGVYVTHTRIIPGAIPKFLVAGIWLLLAAGFLVIAFVILPMPRP